MSFSIAHLHIKLRFKEILREVLEFVVATSMLSDIDVYLRVSVEREILTILESELPSLKAIELYSDYYYAINGCLNEVCNGLHISDALWRKSFSVSRDEMRELYANFCKDVVHLKSSAPNFAVNLDG